jgi:hypothetical protein
MTARVLAQHPEFVAARVQLEKVVLSREGMKPTGAFVYPYVRQRPAPQPASRGTGELP